MMGGTDMGNGMSKGSSPETTNKQPKKPEN